MTHLWVADCETDPFEYLVIPQPFIWGAYNGREYHEFGSTDEFLDFITEIDCVVYAHNGGKFDWFYCLHRLEEFEPLKVISGRLAQFRIGNAEFRDSINIAPVALSAFQKEEFDYSLLNAENRDKPEARIKIRDYLKSDCLNLFELVSNFRDNYGDKLTIAGSALSEWEKISGKKAPETTASFYESFSKFYYGGRTEVFKGGLYNSNLTVIDINSAYPYAMTHRHPWGDSYTISDKLPGIDAVQRSFINLRCVSYGALPFRSKTGLSFPNDNDERDYFVTGWEYLAAVETKTIRDVEILSVTTFSDSIEFGDYVSHFFGLKSEAKRTGNKADYLFAKLFLNGLYGKFAANPEKYDEFTVVRPEYIQDACETDGFSYCARINKWALLSKPLHEDKHRFYNVATAASITGFVRAYLWRAINQCRGVHYCDTDSIVCEDTGGLDLHPTELGAWDIEMVSDYGGFAGKKLYAMHGTGGNWKTASKGVNLSADEIIRVAQGEVVRYLPEAPTFSLKRGISFIPRNIEKTA